MKAIFLYITVFIITVTVLGSADLVSADPLLLAIFIVASAVLVWCCKYALGITEADVRKYMGYDAYCKLLKINDNE